MEEDNDKLCVSSLSVVCLFSFFVLWVVFFAGSLSKHTGLLLPCLWLGSEDDNDDDHNRRLRHG